MTTKVLPISDRGQITIPIKARKKLGSEYVSFEESDGIIILKPLKTREDFIAELDEIEKDWEVNGGTSFEEVIKKSQKAA